MPFLIRHSWFGFTHWSIEYGQPASHRKTERFGQETARIEISTNAARLGIDELLRLAAVKDACHGA